MSKPRAKAGKAVGNKNMAKNSNHKSTKKPANNDALQNVVANLLQDQIKNIFLPDTPQRKRLASERRFSDSDALEDDEPTITPAAKKSKPAEQQQQKNKSYSAQVVLLDGVHDNLKSNPSKFLAGLRSLKPGLEIKSVRKTASGSMLIVPKEPKDCNTLLKEGAFLPNSILGPNVSARLPKAQTITHQVIIKQLDAEVTEDEVKEMLNRQELPFVNVKRIWSRQRNAPTEMMRLLLKDEGKKNQLLKNGIYLDQMHFKCVPAKEDQDKKLVFQCWNCQQWNDHKTFDCKNETKCVLCAGSHRKSECTKQKTEAECANCKGNHPAWSTECTMYQTELSKKKTFSSATSDSVKTSSLIADTVKEAMQPIIKEVLHVIRKQIAVVVAEVVSRAFLDHLYWEKEASKSNGTRYLSASSRITSLAKWSAQAANAAPLHRSDDSTVEANDVLHKVMSRLQSVLTPGPATPSLTENHSMANHSKA